jgi:hypothetical protein
MFVAQVVGKSMEPTIPDGAWCLFRGPVEGMRSRTRYAITSGSCATPARVTVRIRTSKKGMPFSLRGSLFMNGLRRFSVVKNSAAIPCAPLDVPAMINTQPASFKLGMNATAA